MELSSNASKHESRNPIQRLLLGHFTRQMIAQVGKVAPRSVLDVGCGEGYMLGALADAGLGGHRVGVDFSQWAIDRAKERLGDRADLSVKDVRTLADDGRKFDLVMMLEVLEHLPNPEVMLPLLERLADPWLLLSVPWEPFFRGLNLLRGRHVRALGNHPEHLQQWTRAGFVAFVGQRFDIVEAPVVFPWTMVLARRR